MFSSGCRRGILALGSGGGFNPQTLFASGEQGGWWDPSDFSTLFQDSAGTTPVTAVTQPVGKILDKSGRGNHRTQATAGSRPTLQVDASGFFYLSYDGIDDFMLTGSVDLSAANKLTVWAGLYKANDTGASCFLESSVNASSNAGAFWLFAPDSTTPNVAFRSGGTTTVNVSRGSLAAPLGLVAVGQGDIAAPSVALRINGVAGVASTTTQGTGNLGNYPIYFGMRAGLSLPLNGRDYGTIILARAATVGEIAQVERFIGSRMGIVL